MSATSALSAPFLVRFGEAPPASSPSAALSVDLAVLGGTDVERLFPDGAAAGNAGAFHLRQAGGWLLGGATRPVAPGGIETVTRELYDELLAATRGRHLCRIWNYVPHINAVAGGQENYRAFCRARALAFEAEFGAQQFSRLSAASAVGTAHDRLTIIFAAAAAAPRHYENPAQVPAYRYPPEHGPRSPSFARATVSAEGRTVFISGTSAIKGHATIAPGDTGAQVDCTLDNLALIAHAAGLGATMGAEGGWSRHFKIYLRHAADFPAVKTRLDATLLRPGDHVIWLQADICRADLNVEIEATLLAS